MRLLYTDARFLEHRTGGHPESPRRLEQIVRVLGQTDRWSSWEHPTWRAALDQEIGWVHAPSHLAAVRDFAAQGGGRIEADTVVSAASCDVALLAAGAAIDAVRRVVKAPAGARGLCLVRPPGHHARPATPMGFCLFNNVALAARTATQELGIERVLIVDWDVHHGNGTQEMFYGDGQVAFLSIHRWPFYPGTGDADETGTGAGLGCIANVPIAMGTSREVYQDKFRRALHALADRIRPQLVLISAGFDAHRLDPIGSLGLETEDYAWLTSDLVEVAKQHAGGKIVSLLEGGYNVEVLPSCVETHMIALES